MTRDDILALEAGRETDVLVAERLGLECLHSEGFRHVETHHEYGPLYECKRGCGYQQAAGPGVNAIMTFGPRKYSSDISCAWEVVEKFGLHDDADEDCLVLTQRYANTAGPEKLDGRWEAKFLDGLIQAVDLMHGNVRAHAYGPTAPLAICRAALLTTLEGE